MTFTLSYKWKWNVHSLEKQIHADWKGKVALDG